MALRAPILQQAPGEYDRGYFDRLMTELRGYFTRANAPYPHNASYLNIDIDLLPTQTVLGALKSGDVYRDTTAGNVLKIKP